MEKELEKIKEMVEDNNRMLRQIRGVQRRAWWVSFFKWAIFIALAFGAYYIIQPFIENLSNAYDSVLGGMESMQNTANGFMGRNG
jgi:hypothetical protein